MLSLEQIPGIKRETPRHKAVASQRVLGPSCSRLRETPRHKAVASGCPYDKLTQAFFLLY